MTEKWVELKDVMEEGEERCCGCALRYIREHLTGRAGTARDGEPWTLAARMRNSASGASTCCAE